MSLYTFILDFQGGTYISQLSSRSVNSAVKKWAKELDTDEIFGMGNSVKQEIINEVEKDVPIPLKGLKRTWCVSALTGKGLALVNVVETK